MEKKFMKTVQRMKYYLTYSEVIGLNFVEKKEDIINKIKKLNQNDVIKILSMLNTLNLEEREHLKINTLTPISNVNLHEYHFYDTSNILYTLKWVLAYGDSKNNSKSNSNLLVEVILLILKTADYMFDERSSETSEQIYTKLVLFNREDDFDRSLIRYKVIFEDIARVEQTYNEKHYDIHKLFEDKYGYSMKQLVSVIFATTHRLLKGVSISDLQYYKSYGINLKLYFKDYSIKDVASKIVDDLSIEPEALKELARKSIDNAYDNEYLVSFPFLRVDDNVVIVSKEIMNNTIYNGLFFKVLNCFKDRNSFFEYFGHLFEIYASRILREAVKTSKIGYDFVDEFKYGVEKKSSDFYVHLGKSLLIFEFKSGRLTKNTKVQGNPETLASELEKYVFKPILQANKCYQDVVSKEGRFSQFKKVFILSGTSNAFPKNIETNNLFRSHEFIKELDSKVVFYDQLGLLDVEMVASYIELHKDSIFKFLKNKVSQDDFSSYTQFYCDKYYEYKRTSYQQEVLLDMFGDVGDIFGVKIQDRLNLMSKKPNN